MIFLGDCLEKMQLLRDKSIDMILCDLPYGTTRCPWDVVIPFDKLWEQYNRIIKDDGAIVLFGQEPFSSLLRASNLKMYRYDWYWVKEQPTNVFQMKRRPGKVVETISVFYKKLGTYNAQRTIHAGKKVTNKIASGAGKLVDGSGKTKLVEYIDDGTRNPIQILYFNRLPKGKAIHPTQKPVELLEYLIKTYTNEGEVVLDNCIGSGSTAIACLNTKRKCIGIESNPEYYDIICERIEQYKFSQQ